jgi:hypothetical protein
MSQYKFVCTVIIGATYFSGGLLCTWCLDEEQYE